MQSLLYSTIRRVQGILEIVPFADLVAAFTYAERSGGLLVYLADKAPDLLPTVTNDGWQSITLESLRAMDYSVYDGPVVGLDALNLVLPNISVHGVGFHALERLSFDNDHADLLRQTAWRLAEYLRPLAPLSEGVERRKFRRKIISLCLPMWLKECPLDDLVALQGDDILETTESSPRLFYNSPGQMNDLLTLRPSAAWTVGFQEIGLLMPSQQASDHIIEIRPVLRRLGDGDRLPLTCRHLAQRCWQAWQGTGQPQLRESAYRLAVESWLATQEADDLIAVIPVGDWREQVDAPSWRAIYRFARQPVQASDRIGALEDVLAGKIDLCASQGPILALPILATTLRALGAREVINLGPVLWNAGRQKALARTSWLLSRDLLNPPQLAAWQRLQVTPTEISELARRAAVMYSLDEPWGWRQGRYHDLLQGVYTHVDRCLERQQSTRQSASLASYFEGLRAWYGCATADDPLEQLVRAVDLFKMSTVSEDGHEEPHVRSVQQLIHVGEQMLHPDAPPSYQADPRSTDDLAPGAISALLRDAAIGNATSAEPTPLLEIATAGYRMLHEQWRQYHAGVLQQRPDPQKLDRFQEDFRLLERRFHAPQHEWRMLQRVIETERSQIDALRQALAGGAVIEILARGQELVLGTRQPLVFEVRNSGARVATDLQLTLQSYLGLELLTPDTTVEFPSLQPGDRQRVEYQGRLLQPAPVVFFSYRFRNEEQRLQRGQRRVSIPVTGAMPAPRFRVNPFEVGRPVSGAGVAFFGRQQELGKILSRLAKPEGTQPLVLRGPRRIGKSSLLREIEAVLDHPGEESRALNIAPETLGALANVRPVFASLQRIGGADEAAFVRFLRGLLRDIAQKLAIQPDPFEVAFEQNHPLHTSVHAFISEVDSILQQRPAQRLVILLDELDELFQPAASVIAGQLRSIIETQRRVSWVTTSTRLVRSAVGKHGSPWFNLLEIIPLRALDWAAATQLVRQLGGQAGCDWGPAAVTTLLEATGQRPYLTQLLGARVTDRLNATGRDLVEPVDVEAAISSLLQDAMIGRYLGQAWQDATPLGQLILWTVSESNAPIGQVDMLRAIRQEAGRQGLTLDRVQIDKAFDEQISWLTEIADALDLRSGRYMFAFPLIERLIRSKVERSEDFVSQTLQELPQRLENNT